MSDRIPLPFPFGWFPIWENEIHRTHPVPCDAEGPILRLCRFYPRRDAG